MLSSHDKEEKWLWVRGREGKRSAGMERSGPGERQKQSAAVKGTGQLLLGDKKDKLWKERRYDVPD